MTKRKEKNGERAYPATKIMDFTRFRLPSVRLLESSASGQKKKRKNRGEEGSDEEEGRWGKRKRAAYWFPQPRRSDSVGGRRLPSRRGPYSSRIASSSLPRWPPLFRPFSPTLSLSLSPNVRRISAATPGIAVRVGRYTSARHGRPAGRYVHVRAQTRRQTRARRGRRKRGRVKERELRWRPPVFISSPALLGAKSERYAFPGRACTRRTRQSGG